MFSVPPSLSGWCSTFVSFTNSFGANCCSCCWIAGPWRCRMETAWWPVVRKVGNPVCTGHFWRMDLTNCWYSLVDHNLVGQNKICHGSTIAEASLCKYSGRATEMIVSGRSFRSGLLSALLLGCARKAKVTLLFVVASHTPGCCCDHFDSAWRVPVKDQNWV